tara:strand:- start:3780 stop:4613 length:834 start_codon:yes stop_codon:yes gene_type:complete
MSSLKFKALIDNKNYKQIRKINVSIAHRLRLRNYASNQRVLSIASLLNNVPNFSKKKYKYRQTSIVKMYTKYSKQYANGDYTAIGNATKLISFYLYGLIPQKDLLGKNLTNFKHQSFSKIAKSDINEKKIKSFKKNRQWPHLTLMLYPKYNRGSCHDYTLLRAMLFERQHKSYKLEISTGTNTFLSHMNVRKIDSKRTTIQKKMSFILMTLFHTFRTYQTLKYVTKSKLKIKSLENTIYSILLNCTQSEMLALALLQYFLTRRHNSFVKIKDVKFRV